MVNPYSEKQIYEAIIHLADDENKIECGEEIPQPESVSLTSLEVAV